MIEVTDPATALLSLSAVVIDTETTSLDVSRARIVQIGALKLSEGRIDENQTFDELIDPGEPVPASSKAIHGITDAKLRGKPQFAEVASRYAAFAGRQPVLGYSLGFDLAVLAREYARAGLVFAAPRSLDVRSLVDLVAPNLPDTALETVAAWLNLSSEGRHTALGDARITARVFLEIVPQLRRRGIRTLAEAEASCRQHSDRNIAATQPVGGVDARSVTALARVDTWPYRHRVRDVMRTPPLIVPAAAALHEVLAQLLARRASSAFVDLGSARYGIITERDVLRALHSFGRDAPASPASAAASAPLESVAADAFVYKAIGRMRRREFRHLGVLDAAGKLVGSLSQRDLLKLRADDAVALTDGIDEAAGVAALSTVWRNLTGAVRSLITEEADAHDAAAIISAEVCALTRRAAEMAARELPFVAPPQFCLMVLGSAGRGESLLAMDQDNAIVFEESSGGAGSDRWLESLAGHVNAILDEVGVPLCKGGVMARNPLWRKSTAGWRRHIAAWLSRSSPEDILNADIFFDAVPVYGEAALAEELRRDAIIAAGSSPGFLKLMSSNAALVDSPFGWFGRWRLDEGRLDLKKDGLLPLFSVARVLALRHGSLERSTPARLEAARTRANLHQELIDRLIEAHRLVIGAILHQQLVDIERGIPPSNRVDPKQLPAMTEDRLRWALGEVANVGDLLDVPPG